MPGLQPKPSTRPGTPRGSVRIFSVIHFYTEGSKKSKGQFSADFIASVEKYSVRICRGNEAWEQGLCEVVEIEDVNIINSCCLKPV